ncbi:MAG: hypothetical protein P8X87_00690 [Candidatus Bathyarchaeota archaeon]
MSASRFKMEERPLLYMMTWRCTRACNYNCTNCSFGSQPYPINEMQNGSDLVVENP